MLTYRHRKNRSLFARAHIDWAGTQSGKNWRNVFRSDESKINLVGNDGRTFIRCQKNAAYDPHYTKKSLKHGGACIRIWRIFFVAAVGPIFWIQKNVNKNVYVDILQKVMLSVAEWKMPLKW